MLKLKNGWFSLGRTGNQGGGHGKHNFGTNRVNPSSGVAVSKSLTGFSSVEPIWVGGEREMQDQVGGSGIEWGVQPRYTRGADLICK